MSDDGEEGRVCARNWGAGYIVVLYSAEVDLRNKLINN